MRSRKLGLLVVAVGLLALGVPMAAPAWAQTSGTVTVQATNTSKMTIVISDTTMGGAGVNLAPDGSGTGGELSSVLGSTGTQGAYYIWTPSTVPNITVKSNVTWNGSVIATENSGTSTSMTVAGGVLRRCTSVPASYTAAAACTALTTTGTSNNWKASQASGVSTHTDYLGLRVDWNDTTGTFASTLTYSVAP